jgi:hypothetical protein
MPTKTDFNAQSGFQTYDLQETTRGECNSFVGQPTLNTGSQVDPNSTRLYDSSNCNSITNLYNPNGLYSDQNYTAHETDRENCGNITNIFANSGNTFVNDDHASQTQRGESNGHFGFVNNETSGKTNRNYKANITQRENSVNYSGNPHTYNGGSSRNQEINVTQRGDSNMQALNLKGTVSMRDYTSELNSDPFLSKESVLRNRVSGGQNVNIRDDPENIINNTCQIPDDTCIRPPGHMNMPGTYGQLGDLESQPRMIENRRVSEFDSIQIKPNELTMQPLYK